MRTNIEIDDVLMREAQKASGHATKKQTVEEALRLMIRLRRQHEVDAAFGRYRTAVDNDHLASRLARLRPKLPRQVEALLRRFEIVSMVGDAIAVAGVRNFRFLRGRGITIRKTIDLLIGTWCIENRASLLHNDSDFHPMTRYLGLREFMGRER